MPFPLISCMCVSKNDIKLPIACFEAQTYPNLELVIVHSNGGLVHELDLSDGDDPAQYDIVLKNERIKLVYVPDIQSRTMLGSRHNLAIQKAEGEFCITWDDDDWYHPERVEKQFLEANQKFFNKCIMLDQLQLYDYRTGRAFLSGKRQWEPSLFAPRSLLLRHPHQNMESGHDTKLLIELSNNAGGVGTMHAPHLFIHTFHYSNTKDREHAEGLMLTGTEMSPDKTAEIREKLEAIEQYELDRVKPEESTPEPEESLSKSEESTPEPLFNDAT